MARRYEKKIIRTGTLRAYAVVGLFPKGTRDDLSKLYSFIRIVDEYASITPPDIESFKYIVRRWTEIKRAGDFGRHKPADKSLPEKILANIVYIVHRFDVDTKLVDDFLRSTAQNIKKKNYSTIRETMDYIDGSAETVGVLAAKTMRLPNAAIHFAQMQARAIKFIRLMRDIGENSAQGRHYFPANELKKFGLTRLDETQALKKPEHFKKFIEFQLKRYKVWQEEASKGLYMVPRRLRRALKTTIDSYAWVAKKIEKDPFIVFDRKVKPSHIRRASIAARRVLRP